MYPVKQSTAITVPVFAHDANGDAVTGLLDAGFTKRISKNGAAFAAMTVTITEMENGWYSLPLSTAHTDTLGLLTITLLHGSAKQINLQFRVHASLPDDLALASVCTEARLAELDAANLPTDVANVQADTDDIQTRLPAALVGGRIDASVGAYGAALDFNATQKASINSEVDGALDTAIPVTPTADSVNERLKRLEEDVTPTRAGNLDNLDAAISTRATPAQVNTEVDNALDTAIPVTPTADSVNERLKALDDLLQSGGSGDAAAILADTADMQPKLGAPAGASVSADIAAVKAAIDTDTIPELAQAIPPATPTLKQAVMLPYMSARNKVDVTATTKEIHNDAGTVIAKKALSDDGTTYSEAEMVAGP